MNLFLLLLSLAFIAWGVAAFVTSARDSRPRHIGCCPDCGHGQCNYHSQCVDCSRRRAVASVVKGPYR